MVGNQQAASHWTNSPIATSNIICIRRSTGAWPIEKERLILKYAEKATREAKVYTTLDRSESELRRARSANSSKAICEDPEFLRAVEEVRATGISSRAASTRWRQTLIKLTAPGVPDFYQGCELWDLSLVDPDNRRPVDFDLRRALLPTYLVRTPEQVMARADEGLPSCG